MTVRGFFSQNRLGKLRRLREGSSAYLRRPLDERRTTRFRFVHGVALVHWILSLSELGRHLLDVACFLHLLLNPAHNDSPPPTPRAAAARAAPRTPPRRGPRRSSRASSPTSPRSAAPSALASPAPRRPTATPPPCSSHSQPPRPRQLPRLLLSPPPPRKLQMMSWEQRVPSPCISKRGSTSPCSP
jgi:hypothetical protein